MSKDILTVGEVAADLRCSKAHVYKAILGRVPGVTPLPAIHLGRRRLVRKSAFELWKVTNERAPVGGKLISSQHAVDA